MWIEWGPEAPFLYNDAYMPVLSLAKHSWALGRPAAEVWAEIWDVCGPLADKVFRQAEPTFVEDVRLFMNRGDYVEETYYSSRTARSAMSPGASAATARRWRTTDCRRCVSQARRRRTSRCWTSAFAPKVLVLRVTRGDVLTMRGQVSARLLASQAPAARARYLRRYTNQRMSTGALPAGKSNRSMPCVHSVNQPVGGHACFGKWAFS